MDACPPLDIPNTEYFKRFSREVVRRRIPLFGTIELTHRCNFDCVHCYAHDTERGRPELQTGEVLGVLDQALDAGCLYLLLTGGDPFMHSGFADIYAHARRGGMIVAVNTNGALIDDRAVELFVEFPPVGVEVTLYGATRETYEGITRVPGSFDRCLTNIRLLCDRGIRVKLKAVLLRQNLAEIRAIGAMAEEFGVPFRMDAQVFPRLNGDKTPLDFRVDPAVATEAEMTPEVLAGWRAQSEQQSAVDTGDRLYVCGAGMMSFHVDPWAYLRPCMMVRDVAHDLRGLSFTDAWKRIGSDMDRKRMPLNMKCRGCRLRSLCGYCPGFFGLENGDETQYSTYLCNIGMSRLAAVQAPSNGGANVT